MRALVTGSAGFVGRHIARALGLEGWHVRRSDPRHDDYRQSSDCRSHFSSVWPNGDPVTWDLVVHCAAKVDGREAIDGKPALIGAYNLSLDAALWEWALKAQPGRIVYFSSSAAYPVALQDVGCHCELYEAILDCDDPWTPDATYGWVKLTGERLAIEVRKAGVPVTVVRPFSGYGEDQDDCYPFPAMIARAARRDNPFVVWGDGQQVRDFIHIDDIIGAILALIDAEIDGPINLGTGIATSMDELARVAMHTVGYDAPIQHLADKPSGVHYRVADTKLMSRYYTPKISLKQGIERALGVAQRLAA